VTDRAAILAEIIELNTVPTQEDVEFTLADYRSALVAQGQQVSDTAARERLMKMVTDGILTTRLAYVPAVERTCRVWRKV
jgi:hypothetical protein